MMVVPFIFIIFILAFTILTLGFIFKEYVLGSVGSMFVIILGIDVLVNGLLGLSNELTFALGMVLIGLGFYILIKGQLDILPESM